MKTNRKFTDKDNKSLKEKVSGLEATLERTSRELTQFESERKL